MAFQVWRLFRISCLEFRAFACRFILRQSFEWCRHRHVRGGHVLAELGQAVRRRDAHVLHQDQLHCAATSRAGLPSSASSSKGPRSTRTKSYFCASVRSPAAMAAFVTRSPAARGPARPRVRRRAIRSRPLPAEGRHTALPPTRLAAAGPRNGRAADCSNGYRRGPLCGPAPAACGRPPKQRRDAFATGASRHADDLAARIAIACRPSVICAMAACAVPCKRL